MKFLINYKQSDKYLFLISILTILLFFFGFYLQENSAGAGGLKGDFNHVWNNLSLFKNNNFWTALDSTAGLNEYKYKRLLLSENKQDFSNKYSVRHLLLLHH